MRELGGGGGGGGYADKVRPAGHHVLGEWGCAPVRRGCAGGGGMRWSVKAGQATGWCAYQARPAGHHVGGAVRWSGHHVHS